MATLEGCGSCSTWEALAALCNGNFGRFVGFGIMKRYDENYVRNYIDTSSATLGADVLAMANMTDPDGKYLFMLPLIQGTVEPARADENFVSDDSGENYSLGTGQKVSFTWQFFKQPQSLATRLQNMTCTDFDIFLIDVDGNLIGSEYVDGDHTKMYGWAVNKDSFVASFMPGTAAATSMVKVVFDLISVLEKSSVYSILTAEQLGYNAGATLLPAKHLEAVADVVDATHLTVVLRAQSLSSNQYQYGRGLTVANGGVWKVINETAGTTQTLLNAAVVFTDVDPDSVSVGNEPSYTLTITAGTAGDDAHVEVTFPGYLVQTSNKVDLV